MKKPLWIQAIEKYDLGISKDKITNDIKGLSKVYPDKSENERFFILVKNTVGAELNNIGEEWCDLLSWLKISERKEPKDWFSFEFEEPEDYLHWKEFRLKVFGQVKNYKIINFFELNCVDFVAESQFVKEHNFNQYYSFKCDFEEIIMVTNGKFIQVLDKKYIEFESIDFLTLYRSLFSKGYTITPLGQSYESRTTN